MWDTFNDGTVVGVKFDIELCTLLETPEIALDSVSVLFVFGNKDDGLVAATVNVFKVLEAVVLDVLYRFRMYEKSVVVIAGAVVLAGDGVAAVV